MTAVAAPTERIAQPRGVDLAGPPDDGRRWSLSAPPYLVPGTVLVAYLVATGRWGSHVGMSSHSLYITDVGLMVTALWALLRHRHSLAWDGGRLLAITPVLLLVAWSVLRFAMNTTLDTMALRDLAAYLYALVVVVGLVRVRPEARRRTLVVLEAALVLHAGWITLSMHLGPSILRHELSGGLLYVLDTRPDFDAAMLSVLAALAVRTLIRGPGVWRRVVSAGLAIWAVHLVLQLGSRAGALALLASLAVVMATLASQVRLKRGQLAGVAAAMVVLVAVLLPNTSLWGRVTGDPAFDANPAAGTASARQMAWESVLSYVNESPSRVAIGVGPGPDFLVASGARPYFGNVHQGDIRVPHNVLLNVYARLGLIGLGLFVAVLVQWLRAAWVHVFRRRYDQLSVTYVLVSGTLFVTALFGVILESPFGAVPFFWVLGQLLTTAVRQTASELVGVRP